MSPVPYFHRKKTNLYVTGMYFNITPCKIELISVEYLLRGHRDEMTGQCKFKQENVLISTHFSGINGVDSQERSQCKKHHNVSHSIFFYSKKNYITVTGLYLKIGRRQKILRYHLFACCHRVFT